MNIKHFTVLLMVVWVMFASLISLDFFGPIAFLLLFIMMELMQINEKL